MYDILYYLSYINSMIGYIGEIPYRSKLMVLKPKTLKIDKIIPQEPLWIIVKRTGPFVQLAAVSGALAICIGAYYEHKNYSSDEKKNHVFNIASQYHYIHALAMLGLPMCRKPYVSGIFMVLGKILFCGTCYFYSITGNSKYNILSAFGGTCFILGWLSMLL